jgi:hypothetical protein
MNKKVSEVFRIAIWNAASENVLAYYRYGWLGPSGEICPKVEDEYRRLLKYHGYDTNGNKLEGDRA